MSDGSNSSQKILLEPLKNIGMYYVIYILHVTPSLYPQMLGDYFNKKVIIIIIVSLIDGSNHYPAETFAISIEPGQHALHCSLTWCYTIGRLTSCFHLDIPKHDNGQFQKWKMD